VVGKGRGEGLPLINFRCQNKRRMGCDSELGGERESRDNKGPSSEGARIMHQKW